MENRLKKGLGRGLSSLLGDSEKKIETNKISIKDITRSKFQPRKHFSKESLEELTNSIKEQGLIQPIVVRPNQSIKGKYEIIAGERRWLASQNAGLHEVPVVILDVDDCKSLEFAIVENVQRHDLNSIEEAQGYQRLMNQFGYDQEKVAKFIGKSRAHVANCIRLLSLPNDVIKLIETDQLSQGHAKILVGLENAYLFAKKIIQKKLSVRQSENLVRLFKNPKKSKNNTNSSNLRDLEDILEKKLGIKVLIRNKKNNSGSIVFDYRDLDQLNRLIEIIKSNY